MILPFSTQINGKPSEFVSKIWIGIEYKFSEFNYKGNRLFNFPKEYIECGQKGLLTFQRQKPKIHTIREDKKDRWKVGTKIDFFINVRQKNMFRFAPVLQVVCIQKIKIRWYSPSDETKTARIYIDDKSFACAIWHKGKEDNPIYTGKGFLKFCQNDGFDTIDDFFKYFDKDFEGKLIHWTDKRY